MENISGKILPSSFPPVEKLRAIPAGIKKLILTDNINWALVLILYFPVLLQLYRFRWQSIDYTHAYFILPVSLWLAWKMRQKLLAITGQGNSAGLFFLIFGLGMYIFGRQQGYLLMSTLSLIPVLFGMCIYLYGTKLARAITFPVLYLCLMVPPPLGILDSITLPMRYWNTIAAEFILKLINYPVIRDGLTIYLGKKEIFMGSACSGFRSLITMSAICLAYIYTFNAKKKTKIALFFMVIPLSLLGNLIRIISTCIAAQVWGLRTAEIVHNLSGYIIFIGLISVMTLLRTFLSKSNMV